MLIAIVSPYEGPLITRFSPFDACILFSSSIEAKTAYSLLGCRSYCTYGIPYLKKKKASLMFLWREEHLPPV
jgi:hypothetical protein